MTDKPEIQDEKIFSFSDIIKGRDSSVRVTEDGHLYAVDLVMAMTGSDRNYSNQILRRLPEKYVNTCNIFERQITNGGYPTKLVSFRNAIELVLVLPGEIARATRFLFACIIERYLAGDLSLIKEVQHNSTSCEPIAQLARDSLAKEGKTLQDRLPSRKRNFEHNEQEDDLMNMHIEDKKQKLIQGDIDVANEHIENMEKALAFQQKIIDMSSSIADNNKIFPQTKLQIQVNIHNLAAQSVVMGWNAVKKNTVIPENK